MTNHPRRFSPPWTFDEVNHACFVVRDANNFAVAYVYFESEPGRPAAARLMTKDEARRIAANIAQAAGIGGAEGGRPVKTPAIVLITLITATRACYYQLTMT